MPITSNYIKIKSSKKLKQENRDSLQDWQIAGSQDIGNQPGKTVLHSRVNILTGVRQPQSFESKDPFFGEVVVSEHGGFPLPAVAGGSVKMPPLCPREPLRSDSPYHPYSWTHRWRQVNQLGDWSISDLPRSMITSGENLVQPGGVHYSGNMYKELNRTSGKDGDRPLRTRDRRRRNMTSRTTFNKEK